MSQHNPFERLSETAGRRDRGARLIFVGMAVLGLIFIFFVLLDGGSDPNFTPAVGTTTVGGVELPSVPEGFEPLSRHFEDLQQPPKDTAGPYALTVDLLVPVADNRNLGLYTFRGGQWVRVSDGELTEDGAAAIGRAAEVPNNIAVLRRTVAAVQISGRLAAAQADPSALQVVTIVNPTGISPNLDGSLAGTQVGIPATEAAIVPVVSAASGAEVQSVDAILASPALREAHIGALLRLAVAEGNSGIELDYRGVSAARRADLVAFVTDLAARLHQANRTLTLVLPTPVSTGGSWNTQGYDWERLSTAADVLKLLPERDPSLYYQNMEGALEFLTESVDLNSVHLVVSRTSVEKGASELTQTSLLGALAIAASVEVRTSAPITPGTRVLLVGTNIFEDDGATGIRWDEEALAVSFSFPGVGGQRTVWLENSLSLAFRVDLAHRFGLGGISVEDISLNPAMADVWPVLDAYADILVVPLVAPNSVMLRPAWRIEAGSSDAGSDGNVFWTAPDAPGAYEIALIVSDGVIRAQQRIELEVLPPDTTADSEP